MPSKGLSRFLSNTTGQRYQFLKSRDIALPKKFCVVKAMIFLVVLYGCESWIIKKTENQITDAFELGALEKTLERPLERRSYPSILKDINLEYSLEELMMKLNLQYFDHLM